MGRVIVTLASLSFLAAACDGQQECIAINRGCSQADSFSEFGRSDVPCCDASCVRIGFDVQTGEVFQCR